MIRPLILLILLQLLFDPASSWAGPGPVPPRWGEAFNLTRPLKPYCFQGWYDDYDDGDACGDIEEWDDTEILISSPECVTSAGIALSPEMKKKQNAGGAHCCVDGVINPACDQSPLERDAPVVDEALEASDRVRSLSQGIAALQSAALAAEPSGEEQESGSDAANTAQGNSAAAGAGESQASREKRGGGPGLPQGFGPLRFNPTFSLGGGPSGVSGSNGASGVTPEKTDASLAEGSSAAASAGADSSPSYSVGGGGAKKGGDADGVRKGGFLYSSDGSSGSASSENTFGSSASLAPSMASEDPVDYFSRIDIGSSLFRQISRRLSEKEAQLME